MSKKLHLVSLGCTKNLVDSEVMLGRLQKYQITENAEDADVIIVNTCGFIEAAKQESIQTILNLHTQRKPESVLVMAGCLSERYKEELQNELVEVDIFTGVGDYAKIDELIETKQSRFSDNVYLIGSEERIISGSASHAYIKIAEGCNQTCSFCAIPSFKGKLQSRDLESIAREVENLVQRGYFDFSFVSQDSSSFMRDLGEKDGLIRLIERIEQIEGIKSARILYLYPSTTSFELIDRIGESKIFHNYFDMPIQHISARLLKVMKRGVGSEKIRELLWRMKKLPESFVRTSVIVGHPMETDEEFEELCSFIREFEFDRVNVFGYSDEEGTDSFRMEQKIPKTIINQRAKKLGRIVTKITQEKLKKEVGKTVLAIVDGPSDEHEYLLSARKLIWAPQIDGEILVNDSEIDTVEYQKIYKIHITEQIGKTLLGTILSTLS